MVYQLGFKDPSLLKLYSQLTGSFGGLSDAQLDRRLSTLDYTRNRVGIRVLGPDRVIQSSELFHAITTHKHFQGAYRKFSGELLPWVPGNSARTQAVLRKFDRQLVQWRGEKLEPKQDRRLFIAKKIFSWVTDPKGLGMKVDPSAPERGLEAVLTNRKKGCLSQGQDCYPPQGDCSEFIFVLMALLSRAGFKVQPHWVGKDLKGQSVQHLALNLELNGKNYLLDAVYGHFNATHVAHTPLSRRQLLAWYWNNRAEDILSRKPRQARVYYERALQIDPQNPHIRTNLGKYYEGQGNDSQAEAEYRGALQMDGRFSLAHERLGNQYYRRAQYLKALDHYKEAKSGDPQNFVARRNLIRCWVHLRKFVAAQRELNTLRQEGSPTREIEIWVKGPISP